MKEQLWHIQLCHPEKSAVVNHSINFDHCFQFHDTSILARKSGYIEYLIMEAQKLSSILTT
jgi:hypothetical protein